MSTPLTVVAFDALPVDQAGAILRECGGAPRWTEGMLARRPLGSFARARLIANEVWGTLGPEDWRAAFAHHPRIGAASPTAAQGAQGRAWSASEQSGVAGATSEILTALAAANAAYEQRFGHIYIVCATGKSAGDLLRIANARLSNDPDRELEVAAEELRQIMQLRLAQALAHDAGEEGTA